MRSRSSSTRRLASDRRRYSASWRSSAGGSGHLFRPMSGRELEGPGHSDLMALVERVTQLPPDVLGEGSLEGEHGTDAGRGGGLRHLADDGRGSLRDFQGPLAGSKGWITDPVGLDLFPEQHSRRADLLVEVLGSRDAQQHVMRSEERRVGKDSRCRVAKE